MAIKGGGSNDLATAAIGGPGGVTCEIGSNNAVAETSGVTGGAISRRVIQLGTGYAVLVSATVTPTKAVNKVIIVASLVTGHPISRTAFLRIQETGADVGTTEVSITAGLGCHSLVTTVVLENVSLAAHTYDAAGRANVASSVEEFGATISAYVIE